MWKNVEKSAGSPFLYTTHIFFFYKMQINETGIPNFSQCIRIDVKMHVTMYVDNCSVPLPQCFRKGTTCTLNSITQLENFPFYLNNKKKEFSPSFASESEKIRYQKRPHYCNEILCFSLMMRYTSMQSYKLMQKQYNLFSFSV